FCAGGGDPGDLHSFPTRRSSDLPTWRDVPATVLGMVKLLASAPSGRDTGRADAALDRVLAHPLMRLPGARRSMRRLVERVRTGVDRKSTRLNSSHVKISYAVFCL